MTATSILPTLERGSQAAPDKLIIRDVTHRFGSAAVLQNLNLQIKNREFVCILGTYGCG